MTFWRSEHNAKFTLRRQVGGYYSAIAPFVLFNDCELAVLKRGNGPPDPRGAKGCRVVDGGVGTTPRTTCLTSVSCETTESCQGQRFHGVTNGVRPQDARPGSVEIRGG